ncbi:FadR/GntR family transcriptional regulator [Nocardioides cheoyonin]|uniref:FadR/GntR family transcriptional regulator n=1 Tax=Nocardioides cheoyonin TaxID=3156615 RepID=UPI0032B39FFA
MERVEGAHVEQDPPGLLSQPVQVPSTVDEVTDRLVAAIALGEFLPGERLPVERTLAQMLDVARSTVHETYHRLRDAGLVEIRRGRSGGAYVRADWTAQSAASVGRTLRPRRQQLEELFDLRGMVEGMIARSAAERRTPDDVRVLEQALSAYASAGSPSEAHAADGAIHRAVTLATRNDEALRLSQDLLARITIGLPIEPYSVAAFDEALVEHTELVEAIRDGDVERAGAVASRHFDISARQVRELLDRKSAGTE